MKRRLERPVSGSSNSSDSSRCAWATISSCSPLVRPAAWTRVSSSASRTGSTRMSCTPRCSTSLARSTGGASGSTSSDGGAERFGVSLDALEQAGAGRLVDDGDIRLPIQAAVEGVIGAVALGDLVSRLCQDPLEPPSLPRPPVGHDNLHVDGVNTPDHRT